MDVHDYPILAWSDLCHLIMQPTCIHYWNKAIDCSNSHGPCNTAKPYKTKKKPSCLGLGRRVPARTCYVGSLALLAGLHGLGHGGWLAAGLLWTKLLFSSSFELGYCLLPRSCIGLLQGSNSRRFPNIYFILNLFNPNPPYPLSHDHPSTCPSLASTFVPAPLSLSPSRVFFYYYCYSYFGSSLLILCLLFFYRLGLGQHFFNCNL